jgi:hypothetical protein
MENGFVDQVGQVQWVKARQLSIGLVATRLVTCATESIPTWLILGVSLGAGCFASDIKVVFLSGKWANRHIETLMKVKRR